ncbi:MAG: hypothetical protein AAF589_06610 [Planctomycetota bacterium]
MLTATPAGWFTWDYNVTKGGERIASIDMEWGRDAGSFFLGGREFHVRREGFLGIVGAFELTAEDHAVCRVRRPNPLSRRFEIAFSEHMAMPPLTLTAASVFSRKYYVNRGGERLGEIRPLGFFTRKAEVDLSDSVPAPVQVFLLWLVLLNWRRASDDGE